MNQGKGFRWRKYDGRARLVWKHILEPQGIPAMDADPATDAIGGVVVRWLRRGILALGTATAGVLIGAGIAVAAAGEQPETGSEVAGGLLDGPVGLVQEIAAPEDVGIEDVVSRASEPVLEVLEPLVAEVVEPVAEPVVAEVVEPVAEPVVAEVVEPVVAEVVEPVVAEVVEPVVAEVVEPVVAEVVEPVTAPILDEVAPVTDPVVDHVLAPVTQPVLDTASSVLTGMTAPVRAVVDPVLDPIREPVRHVLDLVGRAPGGVVVDVLDLSTPVVGAVIAPAPDASGPLAAAHDPADLNDAAAVRGLGPPAVGVLQMAAGSADLVPAPQLVGEFVGSSPPGDPPLVEPADTPRSADEPARAPLRQLGTAPGNDQTPLPTSAQPRPGEATSATSIDVQPRVGLVAIDGDDIGPRVSADPFDIPVSPG
ncbi:hypothetical protein EXU48_15800 [Occultella glacieicola]|uniref:Uncharacterized protein n=1 Tax=Occultella glacieicola TaxID=2518684 RepID=A0ABY2E0Z9_9MICO|nr:hypothetical protein [Occultella glacieicola]TDE91607.1 hypothetical protein EXU48_15800 [Occultella glacieicola]